jgi:hypothetical protein
MTIGQVIEQIERVLLIMEARQVNATCLFEIRLSKGENIKFKNSISSNEYFLETPKNFS